MVIISFLVLFFTLAVMGLALYSLCIPPVKRAARIPMVHRAMNISMLINFILVLILVAVGSVSIVSLSLLGLLYTMNFYYSVDGYGLRVWCAEFSASFKASMHAATAQAVA